MELVRSHCVHCALRLYSHWHSAHAHMFRKVKFCLLSPLDGKNVTHIRYTMTSNKHTVFLTTIYTVCSLFHIDKYSVVHFPLI